LLDKVYEELPDIQKLAFVREEISIRKEVEQNTVEVEDKIRHEELDLDIKMLTLALMKPRHCNDGLP